MKVSKEQLVSGLNEWLLNASPTDRRYGDMEALRDTIQGAVEDSDILATVEEYKAMPKPVARGFAFDFELTEEQEEQLNWIKENTPTDEFWRQVLKYLANSNAKITYGEAGGPYAPEEEENN